MATVAAALLPILHGGSSGATPVASSSTVSGNAMCLDAGSTRRDKDVVTLWKCEAGNTNQAWVTDGAQVKVKDTLS
jgi:hypothetical protein